MSFEACPVTGYPLSAILMLRVMHDPPSCAEQGSVMRSVLRRGVPCEGQANEMRCGGGNG